VSTPMRTTKGFLTRRRVVFPRWQGVMRWSGLGDLMTERIANEEERDSEKYYRANTDTVI
jgi:hypothetical protein